MTNIQELASNIYDGQTVTVNEYANPTEYVRDLMELADENGWLDDLDAGQRGELRWELSRTAESDWRR